MENKSNMNLIKSFVEMLESLNRATQSAGGVGFVLGDLEKMTVIDLMTLLCVNGVRFCSMPTTKSTEKQSTFNIHIEDESDDPPMLIDKNGMRPTSVLCNKGDEIFQLWLNKNKHNGKWKRINGFYNMPEALQMIPIEGQ